MWHTQCRSRRRRPGALDARWAAEPASTSEDAEAGRSSVRTETHRWHTKRFKMRCTWGTWLAQVPHGKGRGSRAVLQAARRNAVAHDVSEMLALQLTGSQVSCGPSLVGFPPRAYFATGRSPLASIHWCISPSSRHLQLTLPVTPTQAVLLATLRAATLVQRVAGVACKLDAAAVLAGERVLNVMLYQAPSAAVAPVELLWRPVAKAGSALEGGARTVCVWVHAAAAADVGALLLRLCTQHGVRMVPGQRHMHRLDVLGAAATRIVERMLAPSTASSNPLSLREALASVPPEGAVHVAKVRDPRVVRWPLATAAVSTVPSVAAHLQPRVSLWTEEGSSPAAVATALSDAELNKLREQRRRDALPSWSEGPSTTTIAEEPPSCPIVLIRRMPGDPSVGGWSLLVPSTFALPFWLALVHSGCRAVGLQERRWLVRISTLVARGHGV